MATLGNQYTDYSLHKLIVDSLEEDGAICNAYSKEYDEQGTYEGGNANRLAFKKINDKINRYHEIIKLVKGDWRPKVTEQIPVIDFAHPENTTLSAFYPLVENSTTEIDPSTIVGMNVDDDTTALDLIINEDPAILNRALVGYDLAEHFYNTTEDEVIDYNIQVAPYNGDSAAIYKGMKSASAINPYTLEMVATTRFDPILVHQNLAGEIVLNYNPAEGFETAGPETDEHGNRIPYAADGLGTTDAMDIELVSVISIPGTSCNRCLQLQSNDIIIILPSSTTSPDNTRIILLRYNQNYSANSEETSEDRSTWPYEPFYLEVTEYLASLPTEEIDAGGKMPSYLTSNFLTGILSDYIIIEKEYYSEASAYLDGSFCEPKERDSKNYVSKWKLVNEVEIANEKNTVINIGSKYYEGHVTGRGNPIDAPFKLTGGEEASWAKNFQGIAHQPWNGKATYIYDIVFEQGRNLLRAVQTEDVNRWKNSFELRKLDYIVKKGDYAGVTGTVLSASAFKLLIGEDVDSAAVPNIRVQYKNKFKTADNKIVTYEDIKAYIDLCTDHIKGNVLDLTGLLTDTTIAYARLEYEDNMKSKNYNSTIGNTNENAIWETPGLIFHFGWAAVREKKGGWKSEHREERLGIASPILAFAPKGAPKKKTMLIYPDYNNKLPGELYLISSWDLGLQEYRDLENNTDYGNRGMCSFYNQNGKIISFKVSKVSEFLPSRLDSIKWYDVALGKVQQTWFWDTKWTTDWDCYIYTLRPMEISLRGLEILDWNNEPMDLEEGIPDLQIVPMSYPNTYFKCEMKYNNGNVEYEIDPSHILDINNLKNSYIIAGLPAYNDASEFKKMKKSGLSLKYFAEMLREDGDEGIGKALRTVLQKGVNYAVSSFPISDGDKNPMLFDSFEDILNSFIKLKPELNDLVNSGFEIPVVTDNADGTSTTTYRRLVASDVEGINERVDYQDYVHDYLIHINDAGTGYILGDDDRKFYEYLAERIPMISYNAIIESTPRPSLTELYEEFGSAFGPGADLSRSLCNLIDRRLGNDTKAFIRYGTGNGQTVCIPNSISGASDSLEIKIRDIILEIDQMYEQKRVMEDKIRSYSKWFTTESIENAFKSDGSVNDDELIVDFYNRNNNDPKGVHPQIDGILNRYRSTKVSGTLYDRLRLLGWVLYWRGMTLEELKDHYRLDDPNNYSGLDSTEKTQKDYLYKNVKRDALNQAYNSWKSLETGQPIFITPEQIGEYSRLVNNEEGEPLVDGNPMLYVQDEEINSLSELNEYLDGQEYDNVIDGVRITGADALWNYMESNDMHYLRKVRFVIPDKSIDTGNGTCTLVPSESIIYEFSVPYDADNPDIYPEILDSIADFMNTSLEGTGDEDHYVKYVTGMDGPSGSTNSLYYKRYEMLNNRINKSFGKLAQAARYLKQKDTLTKISNIKSALATSYEKFVKVVNIKDYEPLSYFPRQISTASTIPMNGKFYYQKELDALREQIADKCVLTCNHCLIKNSCPFYNEEEILKLYCTEADSIDLYLKDNELDLLVYDSNSPNLVYTSEDGLVSETLDPNILRNIHRPYSDILKKVIVKSDDEVVEEAYIANDLEKIRDQLKSTYGDAYEEETRAGLGFLLNGRYGTVQVNDLYGINSPTSTMTNEEIDTDNITKYKSMYDAVYIKDEETEILYKTSTKTYPVEVIAGPKGSKKVYKGTTKIKIPASLKILQDADPDDELYLVSDDRRDSTGKVITPVIFLNTVGNLEMTFDLTETEPNVSVTSASDLNLYAQDVAQWCVNYAKGNCYQDPIGSSTEISKDIDQYWMPEIKKKVVGTDGVSKYITVSGRPRINSGYQEPCIDSSDIDPGSVMSGRPVVNNYIDFIRRFRIRMYKMINGQKVDTIRWLKSNTTLYPEYTTMEDKIEAHKSILPLMKTNLRLVLVKKIE